MNPKAQNLIGSGVVVHVPSFFDELKELEEKGLENVRERVFISDRCHIVLDLHTLVDGLEEQELGGNSIGTTKRGIGPTYSTKAARSGIRIVDIFTKELFDRKVRELARGYKLRFGKLLDNYDVETEIAKFDVSTVGVVESNADGCRATVRIFQTLSSMQFFSSLQLKIVRHKLSSREPMLCCWIWTVSKSQTGQFLWQH